MLGHRKMLRAQAQTVLRQPPDNRKEQRRAPAPDSRIATPEKIAPVAMAQADHFRAKPRNFNTQMIIRKHKRSGRLHQETSAIADDVSLRQTMSDLRARRDWPFIAASNKARTRNAMPPQKIMLIRHGEKPDKETRGVAPDGAHDSESLSVQGWMRAGALARAFNPRIGAPIAPFQRPGHVYATAYDARSGQGSRRMAQTATPLARSLGLAPDLRFGKGEERALVADLLQRDDIVLVCWSHRFLPDIAQALSPQAPQIWPDDRFDLVWLFERVGAGYVFSQHGQQLLPDDLQD
jgi:hypothetical protein